MLSLGADIYDEDGVTDTISHMPFIAWDRVLSALVQRYKVVNKRIDRGLVPILK